MPREATCIVGYARAGIPGLVVAGSGFILPAAAITLAIAWAYGLVLPWLRHSRLARAFLDGLNATSLALMAAVNWELARTALVHVPAVLLAAGGAMGLLLRVNSAWLVLGGGLAGYLFAS